MAGAIRHRELVMAVLAGILASVAEAADPPQEVNFQFRNGLENQHLLKLFGPNPNQAAKSDAGGLRINLPAERPKLSPVGVESRFGLRGDFEVTLTYELLAASPPPPPIGAGVTLLLRFDRPSAVTVNLTRMRKAASGKGKPDTDTFGAILTTSGPDGKPRYDVVTSPAASGRGQLRMTRSGETLRFLVSDGPGKAFQEIRTLPVGKDDVKVLRAQCGTGEKPGSVDARLVALDVRADQLPTRADQVPNQAAPSTGGGSRSSIWVRLGMGVGVLLAGAASCLWLVRRRHARASSSSARPSHEEPAPGPRRS